MSEKCPVVMYLHRRYNTYMRRFKIFLTIFIIYEFVVIAILHNQNYCTNFFAMNFCEYQNYKYLFMCVMLPALIGVIFWWWPEMSSANKSCDIAPQNDSNTITRNDIEYFVSSLVLMAVQHFFKKHKKTESIFFDILNAMKASDKKNSKIK